MPTCVWRASPELLLALEERFGPPVDAYVNGSQVWLREDGPGGTTVEWRLHPVAGFRRPQGVDTYELFDLVTEALASGADPPRRSTSCGTGWRPSPPSATRWSRRPSPPPAPPPWAGP